MATQGVTGNHLAAASSLRARRGPTPPSATAWPLAVTSRERPRGQGELAQRDASSAQACTDGPVPAGFSVTAGDCAPGDAGAWRMLAHSHVDADADGATVALAGQVCAGQTLPDPFRTAASRNDCDDEAPALTRFVLLYPDQDGDGVGAPPRAVLCLGASLPAGQSLHGYDPDDADPAVTDDPEEDALVLQILD